MLSWISVPVEDQSEVGKFAFTWFSLPVEDQCDVGKFVFFMS